MVRFAHLADTHLGGWKQKPLQEVNFMAFKKAIDKCIEENVEFIIIAGDLFDSAYPPIDILRETFGEFKKLRDNRIPCFIIPGSHDYSVSGKTFLDVLEKAGFCTNVAIFENVNEEIILNPTIFKGIAFYGYPGKKSGMEVDDIKKIKINDSPGFIKIILLHTTITNVKGNLPIESVDIEQLPKADYYALGHIHLVYRYENFVYPGPIFPNNFAEMEELKHGGFFIVDTEKRDSLERINIIIKEIEAINLEIDNAINATSQIIEEIKKRKIKDKIILLRLKGILKSGKHSDIKFQEIEDFAKRNEAYFLLKNTHELKIPDEENNFQIKENPDIEKEVTRIYQEKNPSDFAQFIPELLSSLIIEKQEGETQENFSSRLIEETKKIFKI